MTQMSCVGELIKMATWKIHALIWYQILSLSNWLWFGLEKHFVLQNAHQLVANYVCLLWVYWSLLTENSCLSQPERGQ